LHLLVITHLIGGLGNQMFQYACARRIASARQTTLKLDLTGFATYGLRTYALDVFQISAEIATDAEVRHFRRRALLEARAPRWLRRVLPHGPHTVVREHSFGFDASALDIHGNLLLEGYWQSEKYFADVTDLLRHEFSLRRPLDRANAALADLIGGVNAVSIHVRRGDYATHLPTHQVHGVCSVEYYERAVQAIAERSRTSSVRVLRRSEVDEGLPALSVSYSLCRGEYGGKALRGPYADEFVPSQHHCQQLVQLVGRMAQP
jgi:hypothetical protein